MKKCLVSGSFDPITNGHLQVIAEAARLCDKVVVGVFNNEDKQYLFDIDTRRQLAEIATENMTNVEVIASPGMVSDFCRQNGIDCIVRGFRNSEDYEYETQMSKYNYQNAGVLTYLIPARAPYDKVSSTAVRQLILSGEADIDENKLLPDSVWAHIRRIKK